MNNKVYQFTSKEFQGEGIRGGGGRKREGELIKTFFPLKGGLIERGGGSLIEDLLIFIFPQDFN